MISRGKRYGYGFFLEFYDRKLLFGKSSIEKCYEHEI
jgi:hypothetical protein